MGHHTPCTWHMVVRSMFFMRDTDWLMVTASVVVLGATAVRRACWVAAFTNHQPHHTTHTHTHCDLANPWAHHLRPTPSPQSPARPPPHGHPTGFNDGAVLLEALTMWDVGEKKSAQNHPTPDKHAAALFCS